MTGYASVYNIADHHKDLIIKGAFANVVYQNIKFLWQHDSKKPIGIISHLIEDDHGLKMEAMINNKVKAGREAIELIKQGAIDGLSIGFYIKNSVFNDAKQRVITEADLLEISIVTFPANQSAKILYITKGQEIESNKEYSNQITELQEKVHNIQNIYGKREFLLKYNPVLRILKVTKKFKDQENEITLDDYVIDQNILALTKSLNNEELTVEYISGYDKDNIPHAIKHGIMLHIAEMYDRQAQNCVGLSKEVKNLYLPYRNIRM
ncbi:MAG: HK97 family phage prohead protease [Janthinobacterium lividum]